LDDVPDKYVLVGDEFVSLYLRFWYEVKKYGDLTRRVDLREGPPTPFGERVDKLISSLVWIVGRPAEFASLGFTADESPREQAIINVRRRFDALRELIEGETRDAASTGRFLAECFQTCRLIGRSGPYHVLVLAIRSRENSRESILAEVYFEGTDAFGAGAPRSSPSALRSSSISGQ